MRVCCVSIGCSKEKETKFIGAARVGICLRCSDPRRRRRRCIVGFKVAFARGSAAARWLDGRGEWKNTNITGCYTMSRCWCGVKSLRQTRCQHALLEKVKSAVNKHFDAKLLARIGNDIARGVNPGVVIRFPSSSELIPKLVFQAPQIFKGGGNSVPASNESELSKVQGFRLVR